MNVWEFNSRLIDSCFSKTQFVVQKGDHVAVEVFRVIY